MRAAGRNRRIAIIGVGPRGLVTFERLCCALYERGGRPVTVVLIDDTCVGTGRVWRVDQNRVLRMNTVACQISIFTDDSVEMAGYVVPGPSLYEWIGEQREMVLTRVDGTTADEMARIGPDDYPTRSLYGHYLRWAFENIRDRYAAAIVTVEVDDVARAISIGPSGAWNVELGRRNPIVDLDAIVLTQGHLPQRVGVIPDVTDRLGRPCAAGLTYIPPCNASEVDLSPIGAGESVLIRGLGLTFFDHLSLLTEGRGGRFIRAENGDLDYLPSGTEPRIAAGSRRGVPHRARGVNQKRVGERYRPVFLDTDAVGRLQQRSRLHGDVDFRRDVWPLISAEVALTYYLTTLRHRESAEPLDEFTAQFRQIVNDPVHHNVSARLDALVAQAHIPTQDRWNWSRLEQPALGHYTDQHAYREWMTAYLHDDVYGARLGNVHGARSAALDVLRDLRNEVRQVIDYGGLTSWSYEKHVRNWYTPLNAFLSIGPPLERVEQLNALIRSGVVDIVGPGMRIDRRGGLFVAASPCVPGAEFRAAALIDARQPDADVTTTRDPLVLSLLESGLGRVYVHRDPDGSTRTFGGLDVDQRSHALINRAGRPQDGVFALGVPTESVRWVTAAGPRPCVNSMIFADADSIAQQIATMVAPLATSRRKVLSP